jgi:hypothetical protein
VIRTVTFDANALERVARPERYASDPSQPCYFIVNAALAEGRIKNYFSQTYYSLEGIERRVRPEVLGRTTVDSYSTSTNAHSVNITIETRHYRPPLNDAYEKAVQAALALGLRALRGPARMVDGLTRKDHDKSFYVIEPTEQVVAHREKANEVSAAIEGRGVGRAVGLKLGNYYNKLAGVTVDRPKLWLEGLAHAQTTAERTTVEKAIAEWSDGDGIASHVGYKIDMYCSNDFGKSSGGPSIMNFENRDWLSNTYGIVFVTLRELAALLVAS